MSDEEKKGKRLLSRWDKIWLIIIGLICLYIVLQKFGIHIVERVEDMEIIERPHANQ
ncbi:MAG: hypothetical protein MRY78_06730 [Saprospiraceae bacterium]|nr:hypothetical protein [Saprospiraceae bacterium]